MSESKQRLKLIGSRILAEANDIKRTKSAISAEMGIDEGLLTDILDGNVLEKDMNAFVIDLCAFYPISYSNIWVDENTSTQGVTIMRDVNAKETGRVFDRADRLGMDTPYYEYRDSATSANSSIKPEWIKPLRVVKDNDPYNSDIAFNNGHLLHQVTFFLKPTNFYWESCGQRKCVTMRPGSSNFILPFIPHSFASRSDSEPGEIMAVTFGGDVKHGLSSYGHLSGPLAAELAGNSRDSTAGNARVKRLMANESIDEEILAQRLISLGQVDDYHKFMSPEKLSFDDAVLLAEALDVSVSDILHPSFSSKEDVTFKHQCHASVGDADQYGNSQYLFRRLARHVSQPHVKSLDIKVISNGRVAIQHCLQDFVYNYGESPVTFWWGDDNEVVLGKGDSCCIEPLTKFGFACIHNHDATSLLSIRVPPRNSVAFFDEYATFDNARRSRALREDSQWF